jgi:hypothetical protein
MVEKGIAVVLQRMLEISMSLDRHGSGATGSRRTLSSKEESVI